MSKNDKIIKGRWNNIYIKNRKKIKANYNKIKDWKMDPKGYFLINVDKRKKILQVGYCVIEKKNKTKNHKMIAEITIADIRSKLF